MVVLAEVQLIYSEPFLKLHKMALEAFHEFAFGLSYILYFELGACDTVHQFMASCHAVGVVSQCSAGQCSTGVWLGV